MWLVQCDKYNVTNAIWQIQCSERNEINTMRHACDMHGTCMGHECDAHGMCMGRAPAMHSWGVHWGWRTKGDFGDPVSYGCHVLVPRFVVGGEFWWRDLFRLTRFGDKDCSRWHVLVKRFVPRWHVLLTTSTRNLIKIEMFWVKKLFQNYHYIKIFLRWHCTMDQFMGSEGIIFYKNSLTQSF